MLESHVISALIKNRYFSSGEDTKMILSALRDANKPLTTDEILNTQMLHLHSSKRALCVIIIHKTV